MLTIEHLYVVSSAILVVSGLALVGAAVRAYIHTSRQAMIHLSLGFVLIVAAAIATAISAFLNQFQGVRSLLLVNSGLSSFGYLFVLYSLVVYD